MYKPVNTEIQMELFNQCDTEGGWIMRVYTQGEVTSQSLWSRYDCHFVGITQCYALSQNAKIYCVIQIKLN